MDLMTLVSNADVAQVRYETLEGRPHVVVPIVMMTEGVHKGSGGEVMYNSADMAAAPTIWDHKPIVVYHPEIDGKGASACDQTILNKQKVGIMLHTAYEDKLKCEGWIDIDRANLVDLRIMQAINNKQMMEVSTGVYVDLVRNEGEWQGQKYIGSATNLRADHLALLPDQKGACSIEKGAGLLRNAAAPEIDHRRIDLMITALLTNKKLDTSMSFNNIRESLYSLLNARLSGNIKELQNWWLEDVFPDFCVYEQSGKFYKLAYSISDGTVVLSNDPPEEVLKVTEYRTVSGSFIGNSEQGTQSIMTKPELVSKLITNGGWKESDRPYLMEQKEEDLKRYPITNAEMSDAEKAAAAKAKKDKEDADKLTANTDTQINNQAPAILTTEQYLAAAPASIKTLLTNALEHEKTEKKRLAAIITNAKGNQFTAAYLEAPERTVPELQALVSLAQGGATEQPSQQGYQPPPMLMGNYAGAAAGGVITNAAVTETALPRPSNPFAKKAS